MWQFINIYTVYALRKLPTQKPNIKVYLRHKKVKTYYINQSTHKITKPKLATYIYNALNCHPRAHTNRPKITNPEEAKTHITITKATKNMVMRCIGSQEHHHLKEKLKTIRKTHQNLYEISP